MNCGLIRGKEIFGRRTLAPQGDPGFTSGKSVAVDGSIATGLALVGEEAVCEEDSNKDKALYSRSLILSARTIPSSMSPSGTSDRISSSHLVSVCSFSSRLRFNWDILKLSRGVAETDSRISPKIRVSEARWPARTFFFLANCSISDILFKRGV